jgi:hypothetical protein
MDPHWFGSLDLQALPHTAVPGGGKKISMTFLVFLRPYHMLLFLVEENDN